MHSVPQTITDLINSRLVSRFVGVKAMIIILEYCFNPIKNTTSLPTVTFPPKNLKNKKTFSLIEANLLSAKEIKNCHDVKFS